MSRSGYNDECDQKDLAMWRGRVMSAIRGKRGQSLLRDLAAALDAMPEKRLVQNDIVREGEVCALGCVGKYRGLSGLEDLDPDEDDHHDVLAGGLDVAECMIREIEYENDEGAWKETPEQRWTRMRRWVDRRLNRPYRPLAEGSD